MMASVTPETGILSKIKNDHLTCQICQCPYLQPKALLPCLHTFCAQCLQDFIFSRRYEAGSKFPCPVCRVAVDLSKEGVESFPDNHLIVTLMDTVGTDDDRIEGTLYPDLTPLMLENFDSEKIRLIRHLGDMTIESRVKEMRISPPGNKPTPTRKPRSGQPRRPNVPPRPTRPQIARGNETPTSLPARPHPVQRKLVLPEEAHPVSVHHNVEGAELVFGQYGEGIADFNKPLGLAVTPEGYIVVGDQKENRVFIFEPSGRLRKMFTCQGKIQDLTCNNQGLIYIANIQAKKSMVVCYNTKGHTVASFGNFFTFEKPHGVAVMSDNHMVTTSIDTHQVYALNEYGKMTHNFVGKGKDGKRLRYPYHVAVTSKNRIIVSDHGNDCIKVFDTMGKCKVQFGKYGAKPGQFNGPRGICVDKNDNIIVTDARNDRVQVFTSKGTFVSVVVQMSRRDRSIAACPVNVAMTADSKLVVLFAGGSYAQVRVYPYNV